MSKLVLQCNTCGGLFPSLEKAKNHADPQQGGIGSIIPGQKPRLFAIQTMED